MRWVSIGCMLSHSCKMYFVAYYWNFLNICTIFIIIMAGDFIFKKTRRSSQTVLEPNFMNLVLRIYLYDVRLSWYMHHIHLHRHPQNFKQCTWLITWLMQDIQIGIKLDHGAAPEISGFWPDIIWSSNLTFGFPWTRFCTLKFHILPYNLNFYTPVWRNGRIMPWQCPSVHPPPVRVFQTFFQHALRYQFET